MRKAIFTLVILWAMALPAAAQDSSQPDYEVRVINRSINSEGSVVILQFSVYNAGEQANEESTANLFIEGPSDALIATQQVRPLGARGDTEILTFDVPTNVLPGGSVDFRLEVGLGEIEPEGGPSAENNVARVGYLIPTPVGGTAPIRTTPQPSPITGTPAAPAVTPTAVPGGLGGLNLDLENFDWQNPILIPIVVAVCGIGLILLWVATVILRLLFRPPRVFEVWQPPYAAVPPQDPNTLAGRRQLWQHNAQSDTLNVPCMEGQYHIRKQLVGLDGKNLSGWRVKGVRLSQYDIYGRVARSQTLASNRLARRLDRAVKRSSTLKAGDAERWVRPIARRLVSDFMKRLNKRSMMLPIALDIRFRGTHGEVRILFELYQCIQGQLKQVDQWEPEMTVVSGAIQENYTYSLMGMRQGETNRSFRQRLQSDLQNTLTHMLYKPVRLGVVDDTSPVKPIAQPIPAPEPLPKPVDEPLPENTDATDRI